MKKIFFIILCFFFVFSCKKENYQLKTDEIFISKNVRFQENGDFLTLKSGKFTYKIPHSKLPYKKIMLLNASLVGYITELGAEEKIIGVASPEYIFSDKIHQLINENKIQNIGNEQKYDVEKILAYHPDAIFTNYVASFENTYDVLKKNGIEIIFLDEYLEEKPLEKVAYIKVFGKLLGMDKSAALIYSEIESNYHKFKDLALKSPVKPKVLTNEMYGNQWFVAGGRTQIAHFIQDAHAEYIFGDNKETISTPKSSEEVFVKAKNADFWVNVGNHKDKKELLAINPNYAKMNVYNSGGIYTIAGKEKEQANDYFESGVVRADLVLKDYIKIFHPEIFTKDSLVYMKRIK